LRRGHTVAAAGAQCGSGRPNQTHAM
jgi:hypothetical protein